ncbi:MAG: lysylphosphatidylglycerol synthase domain-containing protein [Microcoleaceae cyanobacterium]
MKQLLSHLKPYLRWIVIGLTLFFLAHAFRDNWQEISEIQITRAGWTCLVLALAVTTSAHLWSGWVWLLILREFQQPVEQRWGMQVYLKTNIAKYLPGNVWHFYGRISAVNKVGVSLGIAVISVLLEPILMASAALMITIISIQRHQYLGLQLVSLALILFLVHPRVLNPVIQKLSKLKLKKSAAQDSSEPVREWDVDPSDHKLERYPLRPFLGEVGFVSLRGIGFLLTLLALIPFTVDQIPLLVGAYSFAWLLGLVIPGAPGGLGVFEATTLTLLDQHFSSGVLLSAVAFYRLVSVLAETSGAVFAGLDERLLGSRKPIV